VLLLASVLRALAPLFFLILLGVFLRRRNVVPAAAVPYMNALVVNVTLPALVVLTLSKAQEIPHAYLIACVVLFGAEMGTMALAWALGRLLRLPRPTCGALMMTATYGNTGFLGYPIALQRLPGMFVAGVLLDQFSMSLPLYLSGALLGGSFGGPLRHEGRGIPAAGGRRKAVLRFFRGPIFLAIVVGLAVRLVPWPAGLREIPALQTSGDILGQMLGYLGQGTTPVILVALGAALRPGAIKKAPLPVALACLLKLVICPVLAWAACRLLGISGDLLAITVQQAAMPTAVVASVLCTQNAMDGEVAVGIVFTATVLSGVTIPIALAVLR